jgi:hypothetical protein
VRLSATLILDTIADYFTQTERGWGDTRVLETLCTKGKEIEGESWKLCSSVGRTVTGNLG